MKLPGLRRSGRVLSLGVFSLLAASSLAAQQSYGFIARLGRDTLVVERVTRTADRLEGMLVSRTPRVLVRRYAAELAPDGTVRRFEVTTTIPNAGPNTSREQVISVSFGADSLPVTIRAGDSTRTLTVAASGLALPWYVYAYGTWEQMFIVARRRNADSLPVTGYTPGSRTASPTFVRRHPGDSLAVGLFGDVMAARVSPEGLLLGMNGDRTTVKVRVERLEQVEVEAIAARFTAEEASAGVASALSPRDTVRVTIGGAEIVVDYGRPARRGRQILGQVVPWNAVWRTGANEATQFTTSRDLVFQGGVTVPAGNYTLWTLPAPGSVALIINRQTGQWGTQYDSSRDLARIPVSVETLAEPVERFTIRIEPINGGGRLIVEWDRFRWTASFK